MCGGGIKTLFFNQFSKAQTSSKKYENTGQSLSKLNSIKKKKIGFKKKILKEKKKFLNMKKNNILS